MRRASWWQSILLVLGICSAFTPLSIGKERVSPRPLKYPTSVPSQTKICPAWAMEMIRGDMWEYQGKLGLAYDPFPPTIAANTAGIDHWQANHFIVYRNETADYLYNNYTPTQVQYKRGTLPAFEEAVDTYTKEPRSEREKAIALLKRAMPRLCLHPTIPPLGPDCDADRGIADDEELLKSRKGWCNEQSRVFVRLCQVAGIPARMVFLFYSERSLPNNRLGHVVSEFYADGRWSLADSSWLLVFPAADGHLMSAEECHEPANRDRVGKVYFDRVQELLQLPDEEMAGRKYANIKDEKAHREAVAHTVAEKKNEFASMTREYLDGQLDEFGILNYPLPPAKKDR